MVYWPDMPGKEAEPFLLPHEDEGDASRLPPAYVTMEPFQYLRDNAEKFKTVRERLKLLKSVREIDHAVDTQNEENHLRREAHDRAIEIKIDESEILTQAEKQSLKFKLLDEGPIMGALVDREINDLEHRIEDFEEDDLKYIMTAIASGEEKIAPTENVRFVLERLLDPALLSEDQNLAGAEMGRVGEAIARRFVLYLAWTDPVELREKIMELFRQHMFRDNKGFSDPFEENPLPLPEKTRYLINTDAFKGFLEALKELEAKHNTPILKQFQFQLHHLLKDLVDENPALRASGIYLDIVPQEEQ